MTSDCCAVSPQSMRTPHRSSYAPSLCRRSFFQRYGLLTVITDLTAFNLQASQLWQGAIVVDLVCNHPQFFTCQPPAALFFGKTIYRTARYSRRIRKAQALYAGDCNFALLNCSRERQALEASRALVLPGARTVTEEQSAQLMRFDFCNYVDNGNVPHTGRRFRTSMRGCSA